MKNYVVIKFNDGKYKSWRDYGDVTWGWLPWVGVSTNSLGEYCG